MQATDGFARLPTYTEVVDAMANGLGLVRNRVDYLAQLAQYDKRAAAYTGAGRGNGLVERLLSYFCGDNRSFQDQMRTELTNLEQYIAELRNSPLHTEAPYQNVIRPFLEHFVLPWSASALRMGSFFPSSPAWRACTIIQEAARSKCTLFEAWKRHIRNLLPPTMKVPEFREVISKATSTSQRKIEGIEKDIRILSQEISHLGLVEKEEFVEKVRSTYIAGMALTRCAHAAKPYIEEAKMITSLVELIGKEDYLVDPKEEIENAVGHTEPSTIFNEVIFGQNWDEVLVEAALTEARELCSIPSMSHYFPALLAYRHISRDEREPAMRQLQLVLDAANRRQIGEVAAWSAAMLIALHLHTSPPKKHLALNPLVKVRIDNLAQRVELVAPFIPTPFAQYSDVPEIDTYDQHLLESIRLFVSHPRAPGVEIPFLYLERLEKLLQIYLDTDAASGPRSVGLGSRKLVLPGVAISAYELVRDMAAYFYYLFTSDAPEMKHIEQYLRSSDASKQRILKLMDPANFERDLERYG